MPSGAELLRQIKEQVKEVDPREVHEIVNNGYSAHVIDVREQHEFDEGRIPGAVHVPRGHLETRIENAVKDKDARVILYCQSGNRSAFAADPLQNHLGYKNVASMTGRITLWKDRGYQVRLDESNIMDILPGYDVVIDGLDNFPTRYLLNDASVRLQIPVVSASILGWDGQLSVFEPYEGPCYRCLYPTPPPAELAPSCGANGVLGALPGVMGILQAVETVKLIIGAGEPLVGRLLLYDALQEAFTELKVRRDPNCPICSRDPESISDDEMGVFPDYELFCI